MRSGGERGIGLARERVLQWKSSRDNIATNETRRGNVATELQGNRRNRRPSMNSWEQRQRGS